MTNQIRNTNDPSSKHLRAGGICFVIRNSSLLRHLTRELVRHWEHGIRKPAPVVPLLELPIAE
jgi:hypothetical protein